ncbi:SIR2 family NAD-dependent protein deacylase [Jeotgalibacillus proteolyticus]|uniref:SIR2 family NAD-dependent protein deacylase n=1 Tax=Jeotgalibacillus proteolyticus TaxID=2082395 RepID=UPI003CFAD7F8
MNSELVYTYINDIAKRLHDPNKYGSASVMVGAGFSKNAISLAEQSVSPNWEELAKTMYESLYPCPDSDYEKENWNRILLKKTSGKNVLKLAEEYKVAFGRNKLDKFIEENIKDDKFLPGNLHVKLLDLNWNDVFTTNYDTLLEKSIENVALKKNYKILTSQNDLPGSTHPRIIKLHGSIPNAKPYIICEEDYRTFPIKYAPLVNTVQQSMLETQLCLIGFSGDDPNFLNWLGWLRDNMGENCPQIYLCGIFSEMSEFERKMLESQSITVVNIEGLVEGNSSSKYHDAIDKFLELLKKYGYKKNLFEEIPFGKSYKPLIEIDTDEYYQKMLNYTTEIIKEVSRYSVLPTSNIGDFHSKIKEHFEFVLRLDNNHNKFILISKLTILLRKCCMPLMDDDAKRLDELLSIYTYDNLPKNTARNDFKTMWFEIAMYLAEMHRIDSNSIKYNEVIGYIDDNLTHFDEHKKAEYYIERCKSNISEFNYLDALNYINAIDESVSVETQILKACLLSQLQMNREALEILKKCSAYLAQKSYSENKTAEIMSHLNLCARSLNIYGANLNDFSDQEFSNNLYNVRKILNENKDNLINSLFAEDYKKFGESQSFNPNTYTYTYGTTPVEVMKAFTNTFRYLIIQDRLCLPVFRDHKQLIAEACNKIIPASEVPLWKWSFIVRTNDPKVIKSFFTKERIVTSNIEWTRKFFDQLLLMLNEMQKSRQDNHTKKFISKKSIMIVLTRFCSVLDDERIIKFLDNIYEDIPKASDLDVTEIKHSLSGISYYLNSNIMEKYLTKIINQPTNHKVHLAEYFYRIKNAVIQREVISDELLLKIINQIKSKDTNIREKGLTKMVLLSDNNLINNFNDKFSDAIWEQTDKFGIPISNNYAIWAWERFPHSSMVNFSEIYLSYLRDLNFPRCVQGGAIHGFTSVDYKIQIYTNNFYELSDFGDKHVAEVDWNNSLLDSIIENLLDYVENEKKLIIEHKFDIFGQGETAIRYFSKLSELVAYVITQAIIKGHYTENTASLVNRIKLVFNETETSTLCIDIVEKLINDDWKDYYKEIMKKIMSGSIEYTSQAFSALDIVVIYKKYKNEEITIEEELIELIKSLKYMDVKNSRAILLHLPQIITRDMFITSKFRDVIISSLHDCIEIYEVAITDINKDYLDALFNLSKLAKQYYDKLKNSELVIPKKMNNLMGKIKTLPLNEVKNIW